ncbi:DUF1616 domain-containing protein [Halorussus halobius]|uniref:DUF1616 domain-containing protein n=1 Tax=Halorussus halobius TaxID=1710537 RepID=UPI001B2FEF86|nr:DUF1616 domain-containing protein [Halorussus halobius]
MSLEAADETLRDRLGRPGLPVDLLAVTGYAVVASALLFQPSVYATPLAVALGLPLLFFAPGYALVSALFPGATPDDADARASDALAAPAGRGGVAPRTPTAVHQHGLSVVERAALGFGVSLALLPVLGVALALSPWSIDPWPVLLSVSAIAVGCSAVGGVRRLRRPPDGRFSLPVRAWVGRLRRSLRRGSALDSALTVGLAVAVVLSVAAMGYAVAAPAPGESHTDVSLLTRDATGELVAEDYPRTFERGASEPLVVEVTNHEGEPTDYSVVAELQRVRQADDGSPRVVEDQRLATFTPTVDAGETWRTTHEVTPTMTGEGLRLTYLVYEGRAPEDPDASEAYRRVHVWVDVVE